jgi:hypothetical protein
VVLAAPDAEQIMARRRAALREASREIVSDDKDRR